MSEPNERLRYAARCTCGAEIIIEEESIWVSHAHKDFAAWQRTHQQCTLTSQRLKQLETKRLEAPR